MFVFCGIMLTFLGALPTNFDSLIRSDYFRFIFSLDTTNRTNVMTGKLTPCTKNGQIYVDLARHKEDFVKISTV